MNSRRKLLLAFGAGALAAPLASFTQPKQPVLIGWLNFGSRAGNGHLYIAFNEAFEALGWKEGTQYVVDERWANNRPEWWNLICDHRPKTAVGHKPPLGRESC